MPGRQSLEESRRGICEHRRERGGQAGQPGVGRGLTRSTAAAGPLDRSGRERGPGRAAPRESIDQVREDVPYHQGSRLRVPITGKAGSQDRRERARDRAEPLEVHAARHRQPTWLDITGRVMHGARQSATDH